LIKSSRYLLTALGLTVVAATVWLANDPEVAFRDRRDVLSARRMERANHTMVALKNHYFKHAIAETRISGVPSNLASVALGMSKLEPDYRLPYRWGGSIKNHLDGLDCTGFIHGIFHYLAVPAGERRFNTRSLYFKLKRDRAWRKIHDASDEESGPLDIGQLREGDVILWPSDLTDGKNLPGPIWGHVGIAVLVDDHLHVTHFVSSDAYNDLDVIGSAGAGINTLPAEQFVTLKQRGILTVFRLKS
jgi:hypothetical protein